MMHVKRFGLRRHAQEEVCRTYQHKKILPSLSLSATKENQNISNIFEIKFLASCDQQTANAA